MTPEQVDQFAQQQILHGAGTERLIPVRNLSDRRAVAGIGVNRTGLISASDWVANKHDLEVIEVRNFDPFDRLQFIPNTIPSKENAA